MLIITENDTFSAMWCFLMNLIIFLIKYVFALPLFLILASQIECRTKYIHTNSNNSESFSDQNSMDHATMMKITRYKTKYNKPIFLYTEENKFSSESDKSVTRNKISHEIKSNQKKI